MLRERHRLSSCGDFAIFAKYAAQLIIIIISNKIAIYLIILESIKLSGDQMEESRLGDWVARGLNQGQY